MNLLEGDGQGHPPHPLFRKAVMKNRLPPKLTSELIRTYDEIYDHMGYISDLDQETFVLITLGESGQIIDKHIIAVGTMNNCTVDIRILLHRIISDKCTRFIVGHNHPDGLMMFSEGDFLITSQLKYLAETLVWDFVDHILFTYEKPPLSMAQKHRKYWGKSLKPVVEDAIKRVV